MKKKQKKVKSIEIERREFVRSALRKATFRWRYRGDCLKKARIGRGQYLCQLCYNVVKSTEIKADHIIPVVGENGWESFDSFINRLLVGEDGWQAICKECHDKKTAKETTARALRKSERRKEVG